MKVEGINKYFRQLFIFSIVFYHFNDFGADAMFTLIFSAPKHIKAGRIRMFPNKRSAKDIAIKFSKNTKMRCFFFNDFSIKINNAIT
ncbi:MAG TPA: hypothetical protein PLD88_04355 [Candidatus Berkiella sp.]|nr:hypothetical protein [Candidatus Berkiella sp.]